MQRSAPKRITQRSLCSMDLFWLMSGRAVAADPVDDLVQTQPESRKAPGIALLVMRNGTILKEQGYGYANLKLRVAVTPAD